MGVEEKVSQVKDCDVDLVVSFFSKRSLKMSKLMGQDNTFYLERIALAKEVEKYGVNVLGAQVMWPRDQFYFYQNGDFLWVNNRDNESIDRCGNYVYEGGGYLIGNGFILFSDHFFKSEERLKNSKEIWKSDLGIEKFAIVEPTLCKLPLSDVAVSNNPYFYQGDRGHIDAFINLLNKEKIICTYDHPKLLEIAVDIGEVAEDYTIIALPFDEAQYAAVGFVELGDHVIVDCRAEGTMELLENAGYNIIPTPMPMKQVNYQGGSIRCITNQMPKQYGQIVFTSPILSKLFSMTKKFPIFMNTKECLPAVRSRMQDGVTNRIFMTEP